MEKPLRKLLKEQEDLLLEKRKRKKTVTRTSNERERSQSHRSLLLKNPPERSLLKKSLARSKWLRGLVEMLDSLLLL